MSIEIEKAGEEPASSNAFVGQGAIQLPPYEGNYEINPKLFDWVRKKPFKGEPEENPFHHIWDLMDLFGTMQRHPAIMEIIKCKLFTHSLDGKALRWLQCLPHASLKSWDEVRDIFLNHFFTKSMTTSFREKISNFRQEKGEEFHEAWFRFLRYTIDCPHHGFSEAEVITSFYDGLEMEHQMFLDIASNGDFSRKDPDAATKIIEILADKSRDRVIPPRSGKETKDPVANSQESKESRSLKAQPDECRPTQSNVDRHLSQPGETKPEDEEWSENESLDEESSDGEVGE